MISGLPGPSPTTSELYLDDQPDRPFPQGGHHVKAKAFDRSAGDTEKP
jgi:hypothetical protein